MAVIRDPETGQFVSVEDGDMGGRRATFAGRLRLNVEAADLTTGNDQFELSGSDVAIVEFEDELEVDEVFDMHHVQLVGQLAPDRTATAEHVYTIGYHLQGDTGEVEPFGLTPASNKNDGAVSIRFDSDEDAATIMGGVLSGTGDFADSAAGLGGGADQNRTVQTVNYPEMGVPAPTFDENDELGIPQQINIRGSDDQGFRVFWTVTADGIIRET